MSFFRWLFGYPPKTIIKVEEPKAVSVKASPPKKKSKKKKPAKKSKPAVPAPAEIPIAVEEIKVDGKVKVKKPRKSKTSVDKPVESVTVEIKDADK